MLNKKLFTCSTTTLAFENSRGQIHRFTTSTCHQITRPMWTGAHYKNAEHAFDFCLAFNKAITQTEEK